MMKILCDISSRPRIDKYLSDLQLDELYSRSFIDRLIKNGEALVNGQPVKKSYLVEEGDEIELSIPEPESSKVKAEVIPLDIVYEDPYLIAVNKPVGMTVHPAPGNWNGTLVNALMHHFSGTLSTGSDPTRPGIVHRLDKDTSGIILVARDDRTHSLLSRIFQERKIEKHYLALTVGLPRDLDNEIRTGIARSGSDRKKMSVVEGGKDAISIFRIEKDLEYFGLLDVCILTGRTHQIRVHLSHIGYPVLGDRTYSTLKRELSMLPLNLQKRMKYLVANHMQRQALHSSSLAFEHPITGERLLLKAPLPEDFVQTIAFIEKMNQAIL